MSISGLPSNGTTSPHSSFVAVSNNDSDEKESMPAGSASWIVTQPLDERHSPTGREPPNERATPLPQPSQPPSISAPNNRTCVTLNEDSEIEETLFKKGTDVFSGPNNRLTAAILWEDQFVRGFFCRSDTVVNFFENGCFTAVLKGDQIVDGVFYKDNTEIMVYVGLDSVRTVISNDPPQPVRNGLPKRLTPKNDCEREGIFFKQGTNLLVDAEDRLTVAILAEDQFIRGLFCRAHTVVNFFRNGCFTAVLKGDQEVDGVLCKDNTEVMVYPNGDSCYTLARNELLSNNTIECVPCKGGKQVENFKGTFRATLSEVCEFGDTPFAEGSEVLFYPNRTIDIKLDTLEERFIVHIDEKRRVRVGIEKMRQFIANLERLRRIQN